MSRKSASLPRRVRISGVPFVINWRHPFEDKDDYGDTDVLDRSIRIGTKCDTQAQMAETAFHEFMHAALGVSGVADAIGPKLEEAVVTCIEHALFPHLDLLIAIRDMRRVTSK